MILNWQFYLILKDFDLEYVVWYFWPVVYQLILVNGPFLLFIWTFDVLNILTIFSGKNTLQNFSAMKNVHFYGAMIIFV